MTMMATARRHIDTRSDTWWVNRLPRCTLPHGKARHPNENSAEEHMVELESARGPDPLLNAYPCPTCGGWHVGRSAPDMEPRPRRNRRR